MRELKPEKTAVLEPAEALYGWCESSTDNTCCRIDRQVKAIMWYYGGLVRERRRELKMTQQELALRVGERTGLISRVEKGEADVMFSLFIRIMNALDLKIDCQY